MSSKEIATITSISPTVYYRFENGALTTDSSGNSHTLSAIGTPAEDASGKFGGAVAFDGSNGYSATDHSDFKPTGNFTVGAWVKFTDSVTYKGIIQDYSYNGTNIAGWYLRITDTDKIQFTSGKNTGKVSGTDFGIVTGNTSLNDGVWHFVMGTWDGSYLRVYVDGLVDQSAYAWANAPAYAATQYVRVGCFTNAGTFAYGFIGSLDDTFLVNGIAYGSQTTYGIYLGWKKRNGLANTDVKTIDGLAISSIKTFNGI